LHIPRGWPPRRQTPSCALHNGSIAALIHRLRGSGGGKSTLLSILALRDRASAGTVTLFGNDVTRVRGATLKALRRKAIAWVPQRPSHGLLPHLSARENLCRSPGSASVPRAGRLTRRSTCSA
jgi:putative ABC transport system ATP-binding protein